MLDQGLTLCRATDNRDWSRQMAVGLGHAYALAGHIAEGRALLEEAIRDDIRTGALQGHSGRVVWLSETCLLAERHDEAEQHARQALDLARQYRERGYEALALHQLGAVHAHANPPKAELAKTYYQQALVLANELGMRPLQAHCHHGLGTLYRQTRQSAQARVELSAAIEMYRDMEMSFWLDQAAAVLAQTEDQLQH